MTDKFCKLNLDWCSEWYHSDTLAKYDPKIYYIQMPQTSHAHRTE